MKVLYIGHFEPGSTSRMRGLAIKELLNCDQFDVADINLPIMATNRVFRSIGWRYYIGPLITNINNHISNTFTGNTNYDLIWVDKGVFIQPKILKELKRRSKLMLHSTPDTAFTYNRSALFFKGLPLYDYCLTTKSFELESYRKFGAKEVLFAPQGYDETVHYQRNSFEEKEGVVFIGLNEPWREKVLQVFLNNRIPLSVAGNGWERFLHKNKRNSNLYFLGDGLFGEDYAKAISSSLAAVGLLSKKFPEMHTTRTVEIPACGTALITEDNNEIRSFFSEDEAVFFKDLKNLETTITELFANLEQLKSISDKGHQRITKGEFEYKKIISGILEKVKII